MRCTPLAPSDPAGRAMHRGHRGPPLPADRRHRATARGCRATQRLGAGDLHLAEHLVVGGGDPYPSQEACFVSNIAFALASDLSSAESGMLGGARRRRAPALGRWSLRLPTSRARARVGAFQRTASLDDRECECHPTKPFCLAHRQMTSRLTGTARADRASRHVGAVAHSAARDRAELDGQRTTRMRLPR